MSIDVHGRDTTDELSQSSDQKIDVDPALNGAEARNGSPTNDAAVGPGWSLRQIQPIALQVVLILVVFALIGLLLRSPESEYVATTELVYTLDESVPDSFLREDRRLLTQMATLESDAVLSPVAEQFGVTADDLRGAITFETVDLSELLRLEVTDADPDRAMAITQAVLDEYLASSIQLPPSAATDDLRARRESTVEILREADSTAIQLGQNRATNPELVTTEESLQRQIDFRTDQIDRLQALLDGSLARPISRTRTNALAAEIEQAQASLAALETELASHRALMTDLEAETPTEVAVLREIERLEAELAVIDEELAELELQPLVATTPIRSLGATTVSEDRSLVSRVGGPAIGILVAVPIAAALAYRTRRRQLWFEKSVSSWTL